MEETRDNKPAVSFVIPAYNKEPYLAAAINSCLGQTLKEIEIVVVDDGSTDHTNRLMEHFTKKDKRIVYYKLEKNRGRSYTRNYGNSLAKADIICVMDADDVSVPKRAAIVVDYLKRNPDVGMMYGGFFISDYFFQTVDQVHPIEFSLDMVRKTGMSYIGHSSMAYKKDIALKFPYTANEYSDLGLDDWKFQMDIARAGVKFGFVTNVLYHYRQLSDNISAIRNATAVYKLKGEYFKEHGEKLETIPN